MIIQLYRSLESLNSKLSCPVLATIGNFDGLHVGHQKLLKNLVIRAKSQKAKSLLISFYPHPAKVLSGKSPARICDLRSKLSILDSLGVDFICLIRFDKKLLKFSAESFLELLTKKINLVGLHLGEDSHIGNNREGDIKYIQNYFREKKLSDDFLSIEFFEKQKDLKISSRNIRELIAKADFTEVEELLGRRFSLSAKVIAGDGRGKSLGFPTANLAFKDMQLPETGVYIGKTCLHGKNYYSVANLGKQPTFSGENFRLEVYLLNYDSQDFYKERVEFSFIRKIRETKKFANVSELAAQIESDITFAKQIIKDLNEN